MQVRVSAKQRELDAGLPTVFEYGLVDGVYVKGEAVTGARLGHGSEMPWHTTLAPNLHVRGTVVRSLDRRTMIFH